jgi:hypothetical protein
MSIQQMDITPSLHSYLQEQEKLIFSIDGEWFAQDFATFFNCINNIYQILLKRNCIEIISAADFPLIRYFQESFVPSGESFKKIQYICVPKVVYNSPGVIEFLGIAKVIKELREILKDIWYRNSFEKSLSMIKLERAELAVQEKKLEIEINKKKYKISLNDKYPLHPSQLQVEINSANQSLHELNDLGKKELLKIDIKD